MSRSPRPALRSEGRTATRSHLSPSPSTSRTRAVTITAREGPTGTSHWVLTLLAEGDTVGKFGPFDTIESLVEQVSIVLESDSLYTVCCDGSPE